MKKFIITLLVLIILSLGASYYLNKSSNVYEYTEIITYTETFDYDGTYYVAFTSVNSSTVKDELDILAQQSTLYIVDMNDQFNSPAGFSYPSTYEIDENGEEHYYDEEGNEVIHNINPTSYEEIEILTRPTLIKIEDKNVVEFLEGSTAIETYINDNFTDTSARIGNDKTTNPSSTSSIVESTNDSTINDSSTSSI